MSAGFIQLATGNTGTAATSTFTLGTCSAGDILIAGFGYGTIGNAAPTAMSDSKGNTWQTMWGAGGNTPIVFFVSTNIAAGTCTVTVTGGTKAACAIVEYQPSGNVQFFQEIPSLMVGDTIIDYWLTEPLGTLSAATAVTMVNFVLNTATASVAFSVSAGATIRGTATYSSAVGMCLTEYAVTNPTYAQFFITTAGAVSTGTLYSGAMAFTTYPTASTATVQANVISWNGTPPNNLVAGNVPSVNSIFSGTATTATSNTVQFTGLGAIGMNTTNTTYEGQQITILSGTGSNQSRLITGYTYGLTTSAGTGTCTVTPNWTTQPGSNSVFVISPWNGVDVETWLTTSVQSISGLPAVIADGGTISYCTNVALLGSGTGSFAYVQSTSAISTATLTMTASSGVGDVIIAANAGFRVNVATSVSDSLGNTYTLYGSITTNGQGTMSVFIATNTGTGTATITFNGAASSNNDLIAAEYKTPTTGYWMVSAPSAVSPGTGTLWPYIYDKTPYNGTINNAVMIPITYAPNPGTWTLSTGTIRQFTAEADGATLMLGDLIMTSPATTTMTITGTMQAPPWPTVAINLVAFPTNSGSGGGGSTNVNVVEWLGTAVTSATGVPVVYATNTVAATVVGTVTATVPSEVSANVTQWLGTAVTSSAGVPVTTNLGTITATIPAATIVTANVTEWLGTAVTSAAGVPVTTNLGTITATVPTFTTNVNVVDWLGTAVTSSAGIPIVFATNTVAATITGTVTATVIGGTIATVTNPVSISTGQLTIKRDVGLNGFSFPMYNSTTGALQTGLSVTALVSKDGGTPGSTTNGVSEIGSGLYSLNLSASDTNGTVLTFIFTASTAAPSVITAITQS